MLHTASLNKTLLRCSLDRRLKKNCVDDKIVLKLQSIGPDDVALQGELRLLWLIVLSLSYHQQWGTTGVYSWYITIYITHK